MAGADATPGAEAEFYARFQRVGRSPALAPVSPSLRSAKPSEAIEPPENLQKQMDRREALSCPNALSEDV